MIDSFVKLTEKVSELLKYRAERKTRKFKTLIEPTYLALKQVHKDYLLIFEESINDLASDKTLLAIAESLQVRRREEEAERRAILQQSATILANQALAEYHSFFDAIAAYFRATPLSGGSTPSNKLLHALRAAAQDEPTVLTTKSRIRSEEKLNLTRSIEFTLSSLRQNWKIVSAEYAKALAASIE
jgi:hypothetical protein